MTYQTSFSEYRNAVYLIWLNKKKRLVRISLKRKEEKIIKKETIIHCHKPLLIPEGMFNHIYKGLDPKKCVFVQW